MTRGVAIGLDLGTSGVRAALVDAEGGALALSASPIPPDRRRAPEAWWESARTAIARLAEERGLADVRAIAVDGTSGTIVPVGQGGAPLAPASLYGDAADPRDVAAIDAIAPADSAARGATSPLARALQWRGLPGVARILHEADWLAGGFLDRFDVTDWNNALKTGFDPRLLAWPDWIAATGLDISLLPCVVAPGADLGRIDAAVAAEMNLPAGTRVVAGTTDGCAAFLATGASVEGEGVTSLGTTLTLKQLSRAPIFAPRFGVYSHRIGDLWLAGGASNSGGGALARHFAPQDIAALSNEIDPGTASQLDYYPLPGKGERFPVADPTMASRETPRPANDAAFLHGLLEGIAHIEALGYRRLSELGGPPLSAVYSLGGGGGNDSWSRIRARVLGVELKAPRSREAAVGVAGLALRATVNG